MKINFEPLFVEQAKLDKEIAVKHNITYKTTRTRRILALFVEIGELANATRCFKYWSNKSSETKDIVYDEYADGLHFLLSLGVDLDTNVKEFTLSKRNENLSELFVEMYLRISQFEKEFNVDNYIKCFETFLSIGEKLKMGEKEIFDSYIKKLGVNYKRQDTNY